MDGVKIVKELEEIRLKMGLLRHVLDAGKHAKQRLREGEVRLTRLEATPANG